MTHEKLKGIINNLQWSKYDSRKLVSEYEGTVYRIYLQSYNYIRNGGLPGVYGIRFQTLEKRYGKLARQLIEKHGVLYDEDMFYDEWKRKLFCRMECYPKTMENVIELYDDILKISFGSMVDNYLSIVLRICPSYRDKLSAYFESIGVYPLEETSSTESGVYIRGKSCGFQRIGSIEELDEDVFEYWISRLGPSIHYYRIVVYLGLDDLKQFLFTDSGISKTHEHI